MRQGEYARSIKFPPHILFEHLFLPGAEHKTVHLVKRDL